MSVSGMGMSRRQQLYRVELPLVRAGDSGGHPNLGDYRHIAATIASAVGASTRSNADHYRA